MKHLSKLMGASLLLIALSIPQSAIYAGPSLKVLGWGAKSGPLKSFGVNSEAALRSAVAEINSAGGVRMGDGSMAPMEVIGYEDSACKKDEAISILRKTSIWEGARAFR